MTHLIVCREYPPAPYPPGGIGTYVRHIARLLAEAGETVHVISQRWEGASASESNQHSGNLIVHRVSLDEPINVESISAEQLQILQGLAQSDCPSELFSWQAAHLAERLIETEPIDVIEAQEWEAPLYYLQLRRALGLGPRRQPPCLVHLHSPSHLIFQHNQWDQTFTDFLPLIRREEYSIRAADALVCPSRYLAREAEQLFSLEPGDVQVIPYAMGDTPVIERTADAWSNNSVCYVGRIELRKGTVEWVDAAVQVASSRPDVTFEFFGSDTSLTGGAGASVIEHLKQRIPAHLRTRFHFRGSKSREELLRSLAQASIAVVPSRWDNLPFTCIEAMSTGLPVLVSPNGGMTELITDGESGWIAPDGTASGLASALRRALNTPAEQRAVMGELAGKTVRRLCSNESVLQRHLELRSRVASVGVRRSSHIPGHLTAQRNRTGMGVVVTCLTRPDLLTDCLTSIRLQTQSAQIVTVVADERHRDVVESANHAEFQHSSWLYLSNASTRAARNVGADAVRKARPHLRAVAFLEEHVRLEPSYLNRCESAFERQPSLGTLSSWIATGGSSPSILVEEHSDDAACVAVRVETLSDANGWAAATYPAPLASICQSVPAQKHPRRYSVMALAQRGSASVSWNWFLSAPLTEKSRWVREAFMQPRRTAQWVGWQLRRIAGRAFAS